MLPIGDHFYNTLHWYFHFHPVKFELIKIIKLNINASEFICNSISLNSNLEFIFLSFEVENCP